MKEIKYEQPVSVCTVNFRIKAFRFVHFTAKTVISHRWAQVGGVIGGGGRMMKGLL